MAERLTRNNKFSIYNQDNLDTMYDKLAEIEDIMEEYGIESVEELDKKIGYYIDKIDLEAENDYLKKAIEKQNIVTQSISKDRDTWKRACELACEEIDSCDNYGCKTYTIPFKEMPQYFYQQAKTEGNDE